MPRDLADWLDHIERQHPVSVDMGLDRMRVVHGRLGLARPAGAVITVGGTNGKGSTVAFIEAAAREAGLRVGAYTSPHLLHYNERVRIDGLQAADEDLVAAFTAIDAARGDTTLTYFETGTLAALWLFARAGLDLAILEVGLGGRLDATNIVDADVAVITTVDLDHMNFLGSDVESIGFEKAGIARAWKPLVLGDDDPPSSVLRHAYSIGARTLRIGCDFFFDVVDDARWRWREVGFELLLPNPRLEAPAQLRNAAVAVAALRASGLDLPDAALARGIARAHAPARLQRVERHGVEYVFDVGHNPQAARQLAAWLSARRGAGRVHAVFAALGDKDIAGVFQAMASEVDDWIVAGLPGHGPRAIAAEAIAARLPPSADACTASDVASGLSLAKERSMPGDRIVVFGSFHTVADAMREVGLDVDAPAPESPAG